MDENPVKAMEYIALLVDLALLDCHYTEGVDEEGDSIAREGWHAWWIGGRVPGSGGSYRCTVCFWPKEQRLVVMNVNRTIYVNNGPTDAVSERLFRDAVAECLRPLVKEVP